MHTFMDLYLVDPTNSSPLLYSNPKKPKSPRIKIIGGLVSSSDWNEVCMEELRLLAAFPAPVLSRGREDLAPEWVNMPRF